MKRILVFGIGFALVLGTLGVLSAHEGEEHEGMKMEKGQQAFTGEVLDLTCYISHPEKGSGKAHKKCAENCIKSGLPVGVLTDNGLALLTGKDHKPLNKKLASRAAETITVHGMMHHKDGMMLINVSHIGKKKGAATQSKEKE